MRRRHAALPGPRPGALRRRRARRGRPRRRLRGEAGRAEERPHPDRRLLPPAGRVRRHRPPRCRRAAASSRSPTCSTTTSPTAGLFSPVYEGHWTDAGTVPSLLRAAELAADDDAAGRLAAAGQPAGRLSVRRGAGAFGRLLVTGGAGFIGSCYVRDVLGRRDGTRITVLDKLTYAGNEANLAPVRDDPEHGRPARASSRGDIADPAVVGPLVAEADAVVNFAAESHVDRSILDPEAFLRDRRHRRPRPARGVPHRARTGRATSRSRPTRSTARSTRATPREDAPLAPRSPYAAAKAAGELLVRSYVVTHGLDAVVTRGSNTYGPYHHPEKLIPLFVTNAIDDRPLPLYGDGLQRRDWLYVSDHAGGDRLRPAPRRDRRDLQRRRADRDGRTATSSRSCSSGSASRGRSSAQVEDRPGHDRRYAMDGSKLAALGWQPRTDVRGRPGRDGRLVPGQRGVVAGGPVGRLGRLLRAPVRAAAGDRPAAARRRARRPATDARRRHRRRRPPRRARSSRPSPTRRSPARPGRSPGRRDGVRPRRARRRSARGSTATGPRSSSTPRPGPTSTAAPATRSWPSGATATATGVLAAACAERGIDLLVVSTNEVFDGRRGGRRGRTQPTDPTDAGQPVRRLEARGRAARRPTRSPATRRRARDRPDGLAVRAARARLPEPILDAAERAAGRRRAAPRRRRRVGHPDLHGRRRRRDRRAARRTTRVGGIHHLVNGAVRDPRRLGARRRRAGPASTSRSWTSRRRPGRGRRTPPRWGVLAPTPLPVGRAAPAWPDAMADYAPALLRARRGGAGAMTDGRRRRCPASARRGRPLRRDRARHVPRAVARRVPRARRRDAGASPDRAAFVQANLSTSAAGRPARPPPPPPPARPTGSSPAGGPSSPSSTSARCSTAAGRRPLVETRELARRRVGRHPDRGRPRVPGARAARAPLPRDQRVRRHRRARLRLGRPGRRGRLAAARRRRPTAGRSCPSATARTRRCAELVARLRADRRP